MRTRLGSPVLPQRLKGASWLLGLIMTGLVVGPASSAWVPINVNQATGYQYVPKAVSDGAGGIILAWFDQSGALYAQRVTASDALDPAWPAGGLLVSAASDLYFGIASDGAGGAIVATAEGAGYDVHAYHVLASGGLDPAWPAGGRLVGPAGGNQLVTAVVSDGAGGAIVVWEDDFSDWDVYAHRILASGTLDPAWPTDGQAVCTEANGQYESRAISDGSGGVIVAWTDYRDPADPDIYAQRVLSTGAIAAGWPAGGKQLASAADVQGSPRLCSDGIGGAIVVWADFRSGTDYDLYTMRVRASGALGQGWHVDGETVSDAAGNQLPFDVVPDGSGGAVVSFTDTRSGLEDIYVQKVGSNGSMAWAADGVALCVAPDYQVAPSMCADGSGGAYLAWQDRRHDDGTGRTELYLHHVLSSGSPDPAWPVNGGRSTFDSALRFVADSEQPLVAQGSGAATVAWSGELSLPLNDVFAMNINATWTPRYVVNVTAAPSAGGSVAKSPDQLSYQTGSQVTLTATPSAHYGFVNWSGDAAGSANPLLLTMDGDKNVTANFASYPANLTVSPAGAGTVTKSPEQPGYAPGSQVTLTASNSPFAFLGWSGDASGSNNPLVVTMNAPKNITANFAAYSVTVSASPAGSGSVAKSPDQPAYSPGTEVALVATPADGYSFDHWSGDATGTSTPTTIVVGGNEVVTAHFTLTPPSCGNWSVAGPIGPSAYIGVYGAWDPVRDHLVVFGGSTQSALANETWRFSMSGTPAWTQSAPTGSPSARYLGEMVYDPVRDRFLIFGGHVVSAIGPPPRTNEVWSLTYSGPPAWTQVIPAGTPPSPRAGHTAIYDPLRDRLIVFGGRSGNLTVLNDVWQLSLAGTPTWTQLAPSGTPPSPRTGHTAIYDPVRDRMLVFGGSNPLGGTDAGVWALSLAGTPAWSQLTVIGTPPNDLSGRAVYDPVRDRMIRLGGNSDPHAWVLAFKHQPLWSRLYPNSGLSIGPRSSPVAIYEPDGDLLLVHGGSSAADTPRRFDLSGGFDVDAGGNNGTVTTESCYSASSVATLIAAPAAGYKFNQWLGDASGNSNPLEVTMDGYKAIQAEFIVNTVGVEQPLVEFGLGSIVPNPSPGRVTVHYSLGREGRARLGVYDVAGREVARLADGIIGPGQHSAVWDAAASRPAAPSGLYFVRLETPAGVRLKRFAVIR